MEYVNAAPQMMASAASDLANIGSTINDASSSAAASTTGVTAPGADEVSAYIGALFNAHAQMYQAASVQAAAFHTQFVKVMQTSAQSYSSAEATNASPMVSAPNAASATAPSSGGGAAFGGGATSGAGSVGGGFGTQGGNGSGAAIGAQQGGNVGVGGATNGGGGGAGASGVAESSGSPAEAGGVGGASAAPGVGGAGATASIAGGTGVSAPAAPAVPLAPAGQVLPGLATAPGGAALTASGSSAVPGLGGGGESAGVGDVGEPTAQVAPPTAPSPAMQPALTVNKAQPLHPDHHAQHPGHGHRDKSHLPLPVLSLRMPSLGGLRRRSGIRDVSGWAEDSREERKSRPWGREELLGALGLRPPGHA